MTRLLTLSLNYHPNLSPAIIIQVEEELSAESMSIYGNNCLITSILLPPQVEEELEKDHERLSTNQPYLGHVSGGRWEIRRPHLGPAVDEALSLLVDKGLLEVVSGKAGVSYVAGNKYMLGRPFTKGGAKARAAKEGEEEEHQQELSEYERDRQANMARNAAFLASLGL